MQLSSNRCLLCSERMEEGKRRGKERLWRKETGNGKESPRETGKPKQHAGKG